MRSSVLLALVVLLLAGCGLFSGKEDDETIGWSAQRLYGEAKDAMAGKEWSKAIKYFEKVEGRFPYGRVLQYGQLQGGPAHLEEGQRGSGDGAGGHVIQVFTHHANRH